MNESNDQADKTEESFEESGKKSIISEVLLNTRIACLLGFLLQVKTRKYDRSYVEFEAGIPLYHLE